MKTKCLGSLGDDEINGKKVLLRVDLDVPLNHKNEIKDDSKIRAAVLTIDHLIQRNARVIIVSHFGYPEGSDSVYSMKLLLPILSDLLKPAEVKMASDCIGPDVEDSVKKLRSGEVLLLENVRFHAEELSCETEFVKKLASLGDLFVNDDLEFADKDFASTLRVAQLVKPAVAGLLMQKELEALTGVIRSPEKPVVAIIGGSILTTKADLITSLLDKKIVVLLGGGIVFPFFLNKRKGRIGSSVVQGTQEMPYEVEIARSLLELSKEKRAELSKEARTRKDALMLPVDIVQADRLGATANTKTVKATCITNDWMGLDIGAETITSYCDILDKAKTILWNGPMGVYEYGPFEAGTKAIAEKLAELTEKGVKTIITGGDTVAAVKKFGLAEKMSHVSSGGAASLEILKGGDLCAVDVLDTDEDDTPVEEFDLQEFLSYVPRLGVAFRIR